MLTNPVWNKCGSTPMAGRKTMTRRKRILRLSGPIVGFVALFIAAGDLLANEPDLTQPYVLLSTLRAKTIEKELQQAAGAGYRIEFAPNEGGNISFGGGLPQAFNQMNRLVLQKSS